MDQRTDVLYREIQAMRGDLRSLHDRITNILLALVVALIGALGALIGLAV